MTAEVKESLIHWNYFLALEMDLEHISRYIEFSEDNFKTYSIELAHLLLASSSEVDVVAKGICNYIDPNAHAENLNQYQEIINRELPDFRGERMFIPRFGLNFTPWSNWVSAQTPIWWQSYNKVKHERDAHFADANLKNVLNSIGGLLLTVFYFYKFKFLKANPNLQPKEISQYLMPESKFIRLDESYFYSQLVA